MTDPVARDSLDPQPTKDGPSVHHYGRRSKDEWDIPFGSWTLLRATDADGREHIFHVPSAALADVLPADALAKVRAKITGKIEQYEATPGCQALGTVTGLRVALGALEAASGTPEPPARNLLAEQQEDEDWAVPPPATPELREAAQAVLDATRLSGWYNHAAIIALGRALAETPGEPE